MDATGRRRTVDMAEGAGFEPAIRFPAYTLSRRAPSTTRPPLRGPHSRVRLAVLSSRRCRYPRKGRTIVRRATSASGRRWQRVSAKLLSGGPPKLDGKKPHWVYAMAGQQNPQITK